MERLLHVCLCVLAQSGATTQLDLCHAARAVRSPQSPGPWQRGVGMLNRNPNIVDRVQSE